MTNLGVLARLDFPDAPEPDAPEPDAPEPDAPEPGETAAGPDAALSPDLSRKAVGDALMKTPFGPVHS